MEKVRNGAGPPNLTDSLSLLTQGGGTGWHPHPQPPLQVAEQFPQPPVQLLQRMSRMSGHDHEMMFGRLLSNCNNQLAKNLQDQEGEFSLGLASAPASALALGTALAGSSARAAQDREKRQMLVRFSAESVAFRGHGSKWRETPSQKGSRPACILPLCSASAAAPTLAVIAALSASSLATGRGLQPA